MPAGHLDAQGLENRLNVAIATIAEARGRVVELELLLMDAKARAQVASETHPECPACQQMIKVRI